MWIFTWLIVIGIFIGNKLLYSDGGIIDFKVRGGRYDKSEVISRLNPHSVLIWALLVT